MRRPDIRVDKYATAEPIQVEFVMRDRNTDQRDALNVALHDRKSSLYLKFLSHDQYIANFAPSNSTYATTLLRVQRLGYKVVGIDKNRQWIKATAPASVVNSTLGIRTVMVQQVGHGTRHLQIGDEQVPTVLQADVLGVLNTTDVVLMAPSNHVGADNARPQPGLHGGLRNVSGPPQGPSGGYGPPALINSYQIPQPPTRTGRGVGYVLDRQFSQSDINTFLNYFGITHTGYLITVSIDGGAAPISNDNESAEGALDSETLAGLAPNADLYLFGIPDVSAQHVYDALNTAIGDNYTDATGVSIGACESSFTSSELGGFNQMFHQADTQGMTLAAGTGDNGVYVCNGSNVNGVNAPASTPDITAVAGVQATSSGSTPYATETAWNELGFSSGGGNSRTWSKPAYQNYLSFIPDRGMPDISMPADYDATVLGGQWKNSLGGTSWATQIFTAFQVDINMTNNSKRGFANVAMYGANQTSGYSQDCLTDVTTGNNSHGNTTSNAAVGWDYASGLGSIYYGCNF